ncbi:MAG: hypothetical protein J1F42_00905 [Lachnospiraceae bacterium]|nr:hypothetical protein [Lachnospiraceae bacterium]
METDKRKRTGNVILEYGILLLIGVVFYFFLGNEWLSLTSDSPGYIYFTGGEGIMPLYPVFLQVMKAILGEKYYLDGAVVVQSMLAVVCTMMFVVSLKRRFGLKLWEELLLYVACMLPFSIYLPEFGITHQIMTEGLTYPLFYIYFLFLLNFVMDRKYSWGIALIVMSIVLMLIRSQLMLLLLSTFTAYIYVVIRKLAAKENAKRFIAIFVGVLVVASGTFLALVGRNLLKIPQFTTVLMIRGFFEADYEDKDLFDTPEMQEIFEKVYQAVDEKEYRYVYARQDLYMWQELVCDRIPAAANPEIGRYLEEHPESGLDYKETIRKLGGTVLLKHFDRYLYHTLRLMIPGFIAAVFWQIGPIYLLCHFIALFLYLYAIGGSVFCLRHKEKSPEAEFMLTVVGFILVMIITVNIMFIGLQRYVVYAMGIFYCAAYLLFKELVIYVILSKTNLQNRIWKEEHEEG